LFVILVVVEIGQKLNQPLSISSQDVFNYRWLFRIGDKDLTEGEEKMSWLSIRGLRTNQRKAHLENMECLELNIFTLVLE